MAAMDQYPTGLIIVPGHALFQHWVTKCPENPAEPQHWFLQSFQVGEQQKYLEHIAGGIHALETLPGNNLLTFSGGRTREEIATWSEASTYFSIAEQTARRSGMAHLIGAMATEQFARDSLENVACSRAMFYQMFGDYPLLTTVVGWEFKRERYEHHAETLGFSDTLVYIGQNNPDDLTAAEAGEKTALDAFREFPFGTAGILRAKRESRTFTTIPPSYAAFLPPQLSAEYATV